MGARDAALTAAALTRGAAAYDAYRRSPAFARDAATPAAPKHVKVAPRQVEQHVLAYHVERSRVRNLPGLIAANRRHLATVARLMVREPDAEVRARQAVIVRNTNARIAAQVAEYGALSGPMGLA